MCPFSDALDAPADLRFVARLRSNGQMTVPNEVRDLADIDDGDLIEFQLLGIKKKNPPVEGDANLVKRPEDLEEIGA